MNHYLSLIKNYAVWRSFLLAAKSDNGSVNRMPIKISRKATISICGKIRIEKDGCFVFGAAGGKNFCRASYLRLANDARLIVSGNFSIYDSSYIAIRKNASLTLGSGYISSNAQILCSNRISIGNNVAIADGVLIRDSDDHIIEYDGYEKSKPINIEDHVWIGQKAMILKGVTVGEGSIVAAGAVVTKNVPAHSLVAGVPAKIIKSNINWR